MRSLYIFLVILFLVVSTPTLTGCKSDGGGSSSSNSSLEEGGDDLNHILDGGSSAQKISIMEATSEQLAQHIVDCKGKDKDKICVAICHRPPGNPSNSKDKILPLQATLAHLNHGGPNHTEHDYLGPCHNEDQGSDDGSGDDGDGSGDDGDGGGDDGDAGSDDGDAQAGDDGDSPVGLPAWCEEYVDVDSDCDGFVDATGEPMYQ